jgi:hypothetical protein
MDEQTEIITNGDPHFFALLSELAELHSKKAERYGIRGAEDAGFADEPLAAARFASPDFGVDPWIYALIRANEKMRRLQAYIITDDESQANIRDAFLDLASQTLIALLLWEEWVDDDEPEIEETEDDSED